MLATLNQKLIYFCIHVCTAVVLLEFLYCHSMDDNYHTKHGSQDAVSRLSRYAKTIRCSTSVLQVKPSSVNAGQLSSTGAAGKLASKQQHLEQEQQLGSDRAETLGLQRVGSSGSGDSATDLACDVVESTDATVGVAISDMSNADDSTRKSNSNSISRPVVVFVDAKSGAETAEEFDHVIMVSCCSCWWAGAGNVPVPTCTLLKHMDAVRLAGWLAAGWR